MQPNDIGHICHVDPAFQLKTGFPLDSGRRPVLTHNEFGLLFIRVDIFAAEENSLEEVDVVLSNDESAVNMYF